MCDREVLNIKQVKEVFYYIELHHRQCFFSSDPGDLVDEVQSFHLGKKEETVTHNFING